MQDDFAELTVIDKMINSSHCPGVLTVPPEEPDI